MDGDTVTDFAHEVKACALGQASSSIMARNIVGAKADELRRLREDVRRMLKENASPPGDGRWADIAVLEPVRDYKARHASTLLTFDAVVSAIDQIEQKRGATPAAQLSCKLARVLIGEQTGVHPRIKSGGRLSPGHALPLLAAGRAGRARTGASSAWASAWTGCASQARRKLGQRAREPGVADPDHGSRARRRPRCAR